MTAILLSSQILTVHLHQFTSIVTVNYLVMNSIKPDTYIPSKRQKTFTPKPYNPNTLAHSTIKHRAAIQLQKQYELDGYDPDGPDTIKNILIQFISTAGDITGNSIEIPINVSIEQLKLLINTILNQADDPLPYTFYLNNNEIIDTIYSHIHNINKLTTEQISTENILSIVYQPQSIFRVRNVTRCTSSLPGHTEPVLHVHFSPCSTKLASGSGDCTVRLWDIHTQTPIHTMTGHRDHVLATAWSPNAKYIASGCNGNNGRADVRIWDGSTGQLIGKPLIGHKKFISSIVWEPIHANGTCRRVASSSGDGDIRIWDIIKSQCITVFSGHTKEIWCIKWGHNNMIYSASKDTTIKVWNITTGTLIHTLYGHALQIKSIALSTDYAIRCGAYNQYGQAPDTVELQQSAAQQKITDSLKNTNGIEYLISGSDDGTLILWNPPQSNKPIRRMTGHQNYINYVCYSPDSRLIASAGFDKCVKLWNGITGEYITTFRGHVQRVYQCSFSSDSRLLISSSADSTIKLYDIKKQKMIDDLPGHADEVYACDWAIDGSCVASGGKDCVIKMWSH